MTARLEEIVRPFQSPFVTQTDRIPAISTIKISQTAVLQWGEAGAMPTPVTDAVDFTLCNETMDEQSRENDDVRIENPDDSSQFIKIKRAKKLTFNKTDDKAPVLQSDFNQGVEAGLSDFSTDGSFFNAEDGTSTDHCKLNVNLKNQK